MDQHLRSCGLILTHAQVPFANLAALKATWRSTPLAQNSCSAHLHRPAFSLARKLQTEENGKTKKKKKRGKKKRPFTWGQKGASFLSFFFFFGGGGGLRGRGPRPTSAKWLWGWGGRSPPCKLQFPGTKMTHVVVVRSPLKKERNKKQKTTGKTSKQKPSWKHC